MGFIIINKEEWKLNGGCNHPFISNIKNKFSLKKFLFQCSYETLLLICLMVLDLNMLNCLNSRHINDDISVKYD